MLPQRQSGEFATFLVKRLMFSALQLVCKRVCVKLRFSSSSLIVLWDCFGLFSIGA